MAKDPAFLFYADNFITGTMFLSDEQTGKYIRLLCAQHSMGHLSEEHMLKICGTYDKDIFEKFCRDKDGKYYNERLDNEVNRRKEYSLSRSKNRNSKKNISKSYVKHMETITETTTETKDENGNEKIKYRSNILLSQAEFEKLCARYTPEHANAALDYLELYKKEKNYTTKSDYLTILRWVMNVIKKQNNGQQNPATDYIIAADGTRIYEKDIDFTKLGRD